MTFKPQHPAPADADVRRAVKPVVVYPNGTLPEPDFATLAEFKASMKKSEEVIVSPRDARTFRVPKGHFFRIVSVDGPQVGDLNLWNADNLQERFFSGKTRALHRTHVTTGDRLWSNMPYLRSMALISEDTLDWYGFDDDGGSVHDVIGTRCDPFTNRLLSGQDYHHCCHSNLCRALSAETGMSMQEADHYVHDVLNVFMCTGFTKDTHQYFMKASPVRPGDYIEMFAEIDLLGNLSTCPGGDCSTGHSSDEAACYPLKVEIYETDPALQEKWDWPAPNAYHHP
ncbi:DUF1989 domain-containing protein [Thalassospira sp.]|uniref:urea carboxylase-associated family protein n=1 Tax=Thalassospira sp. TaxID=1912094 RepID=UPI001B0AAAB7|nr:DUF1989 domain-containing protein [Thalassospira sp.]MBO6805671.1 DUF1989 domain-containing protein [Thalassospira sp.]MBO6842154.1 DUF1989 domain-containing protein [Thalassospira sp.]